MDEAGHVGVFARYVDDKLGGAHPINPQLRGLLDDIVTDGRWDITYLGMQIMVEGLALAAFGFLHMLTNEPLLEKLLLDAGDGWLRERFTDIGIIQFENWTDTTGEYATLDAVAADRA